METRAGDNGHGALAGEEGQHVRQLGALELVVAHCTDDAGQDAGEGVGDLGESHGVDFVLHHGGSDGGNGAGRQQGGDHQPGDQTSQTGGAVGLFCQANGHADGEQDGHVINQGAACFYQEEAHNVCQTFGGASRAHNGGSQRIADAHQNAADGQTSHGQHQSFAQLLQILHHRNSSSSRKFLSIIFRPSAHNGQTWTKGITGSASKTPAEMRRRPLHPGLPL